MCMLNINFKILGEILVSHTGWVNHLLTMCMLNLNCHNSRRDLVCCTAWWSQSSFDHVHVESKL